MYGRGARALVLVVGLVLGGTSCSSPPPPLPAANGQRLDSAPTPACGARNPVRLLDVIAERSTGAPRDDVFRFTLAAATQVCVRIENPAIGGHRVTAGWVSLDGESVLRPSDFTQSFEGVALPRPLSAGEHSFEVRFASKPGTRVVLQVEVAGPVIDDITPRYAATGSQLFLTGEGFVGPVTVTAGEVSLALPSVGSASVVWATTVADMPVGPLTVTTPFGSATSVGSFVPEQPRGVVPFYPVNEFELGEGTCSGGGRLLVRQDGTRVGFVITDTDSNTNVSLDVDDDNDRSTVEKTLTLGSGNLVVFSETFAALDLYSHVKLGRLNLRVRATGACGERTSSWFDLKSAFAPGLVIVRTPQPQAVANRHGLALASVEGELALMKLPDTVRLDDLLVALATDPDSQGAIPDNVLYATAPDRGTSCGLNGPILDTGPALAGNPFRSQWTLERIGLVDFPSTLAGAGIVVAVLDSGATAHADLTGVFLPGVDVTIFGDGTTTDLNPGLHGTGVASVIAGTQGNGGMVGIAPGARVFPIRVLGATGASEGFGLHRALTAVAAARASGMNIQVVNISMAEFTDTLLLAGGVLTRLLNLFPALSATSLLGGLVVRTIIRERVSSTIAAGVAVVAAAGNSGDTILAVAGTQFPANSPGVFAVAATDETNRVVPSSMRAIGENRIALSAPSEMNVPSDGGSLGATVAVGTFPLADGGVSGPAVNCFGGGTSFAAPHMSGAIASILAPVPPLRPAATNGVMAGLRLIETATPISAPPNAGGAGLLNLALAQFAPYIWSFDFSSTAGTISDFAFLPGVGDFALRASGLTIETISAPGANVAPATVLPAAATWLNTIPSSSRIILGLAGSVEVRGTSGTLAATRPIPSFRAAVSPRSTVLQGELILLSAAGGGVQLVRGGALLPVTTVVPEVSGEVFIDAVWASDPQMGPLETFAARTANRIEFFEVPTGIGSNCQTEATGCPTRRGSVRLAVDAPDGNTQAIAPLDWTAVVETTGATVYVVDGGASFLFGAAGTGLTPGLITAGASYVEIESGAGSSKVYAADLANSAFATIQNRGLLTFDRTVEGDPSYNPVSTLRVAPAGTYAYMSTPRGFREGNTFVRKAIFLGGLVP